MYDEASERTGLVGKVDSGGHKILEETKGINFLTVFSCCYRMFSQNSTLSQHGFLDIGRHDFCCRQSLLLSGFNELKWPLQTDHTFKILLYDEASESIGLVGEINSGG